MSVSTALVCRVGNLKHWPLSTMLPHYRSDGECSLCSTTWSIDSMKSVIWQTWGMSSMPLLARFGYLKDCCKVWIRHYTKDCCKVWIRERLLQGLDTWKTTVRLTWKTAARFGYLKDCCFGRRALKHTQCGATLDAHISSMLLLSSLGYAYWDAGSSTSLRSINILLYVCICRFPT